MLAKNLGGDEIEYEEFIAATNRTKLHRILGTHSLKQRGLTLERLISHSIRQITLPKELALETVVHGRRRVSSSDELYFGVHEDLIYAGKLKPVEGAQWTGIVTTIAVEMLKANLVEAVVCVQRSTTNTRQFYEVLDSYKKNTKTTQDSSHNQLLEVAPTERSHIQIAHNSQDRIGFTTLGNFTPRQFSSYPQTTSTRDH
ncbi:hypothetical protein KSP40_PGU004491 [Platanthera guangdongensis]|uniref:Coenzyme F420 hydrogenase/dehydrogenase beta subunit N-terminal domain-containing protein n=1 Tax=Platanthera guangdongensis TaxID=2320717 RepID=A0ABR2LRY8_9ASPA